MNKLKVSFLVIVVFPLLVQADSCKSIFEFGQYGDKVKDSSIGWRIKRNGRSVYITPQAVKEFKKNGKKDGALKNYSDLIDSWLDSDVHLTNNYKKLQQIGRGLYELKKSGTQTRLLGFHEGADFFILRSIIKKTTDIKQKDAKALRKRRNLFDKNDILWEEFDV